MIIYKVFLLFITLNIVNSSHFRGGSITWKPVATYSTTVLIQFTATWSWRQTAYSCGANNIGSVTGPNDDLICDTGCSVMGESIGTTTFYCTDYDYGENWSLGQKTWTYTVPKTANYQASFTGGNWISLNVGGGGSWE
jgi:formylmethanofuran dehydrogenase subunit A